MKPSVVLVIVALALVARARAAEACQDSAPTGYFSPVAGAVLPPNPVIYLFAPPELRGQLDVRDARTGARLLFEELDVGRAISPSMGGPRSAAFRVRVFANAGTVIELRFYGEVARYPIARPVGEPRARVGVARDEVRRGCEVPEALLLTTDGDAIAYRIEWLREQTARDDHQRLIVPAHREAQDGRTSSPMVTDIGYVIPMGELRAVSIPTALRSLRELELHALFSDGSERRLGRAYAQLAADGIRLPVELLPELRASSSAAESGRAVPQVAGTRTVVVAGNDEHGRGDRDPRHILVASAVAASGSAAMRRFHRPQRSRTLTRGCL